MPLSEIERVVAARFARWGFELPSEGVTARAPGRILDHGWHIAWVWGEQDGEEYLELFSQHRMTSDDHVRVWASGRVEELPAPSSSQVYSAGATQAEIAAGRDALFERNRRICAEQRETGLLPEPGNNFVAHDIQEGLSTGAVAPADPPAMDTQPVIKELDRDQLMTDAAIHAAATVELGDRPTFQERYLERALVSAISEYVAADTRPRERLPVPGWDPQPGDVDLTVRFAAERQPTILAELKVDDIEATLWDLLKLASIVRADPPAHAYLVAAAPPRRWQHAECADLFCDDGDPHVWGWPRSSSAGRSRGAGC